MGLLNPVEHVIFKPFHYEWAYEAWKIQRHIGAWFADEVKMGTDVENFRQSLTDDERSLLTYVFRFFVQADVQVGGAYINTYLPVIHPHEIHMMFVEFAAQESNHQVAYAHLIDSLGLPESDYAVFLNYQEMRDKYDYMNSFKAEDKFSIACTLAAFGAFSEGLQLYASFAMLLNFQRFNMMIGMCQIVAWSVRDESLHVVSIIKLFHTLLKENPDIDKKELGIKIREICENVVHHEDMFIDAAFGVSSVRGITKEDVKTFIRYIADKRMMQLGFERIYLDAKAQNPFPWMDDMLSPPEHANFFEQDATAYSEPITKGDWEDAFDF